MLQWRIMTNLLVLWCNIIFGSTLFVVNWKCKIDSDDKRSLVDTKISTHQPHQAFYIPAGDNNLNKSNSLDVTDQDITTEINPLACTRHEHDTPQPFSTPTNPQPEPRPSQMCPEEIIIKNFQEMVWPETKNGEEAKSSPLCLDERMIIQKRKCYDGWDLAPDCNSIQNEITNPCSPDLTFIHDKYCYKIIEKTSFPPKCPYPETIGWDEYMQLHLTTDPIWMPVTREINEHYGIDVMRFTELTENYKLPYQICTQSCLTYFYSDPFLNKKCQIYYNSTHVEAVSCDQKYPALCVYHTLPYRKRSFCSQTYSANNCKQSGYNTDSSCFCEATNIDHIGSSVLAEFVEPYQNRIYTETDKSCYIGLINTKEQPPSVPFIWSASNQRIDYTNWASINVDINFDNEFGMMTPNGWILQLERSEDCILYQIPAPAPTGTGLQLSIEEDMFRLIIKNYKSFLSNVDGEPLVYCFTDADANTLIYRIQNFSKTLSKDDYTYKFPPLNIVQSGPGNYWCEAFLYPDLQTIKSDNKSLTNYEAEYVAIMKLQNYEEKLSSYPLREENLATLQNLFKNELGNPLSFFPRIFKLNDIDEIRKQLTITFHLSSANVNNTEEVFNTLKEAIMAQTMFEFVDFRSVDYCSSIMTQQTDGQTMMWPLTPLSEKTDPKNGFCVTDNVTFVQRTCSGNFIDGAFWSEITENCTFYSESSETEKLLNIKDRLDLCDSALNDLLEITENYNYFNTLDMVLIVHVLKAIAQKQPDLQKLAGVINNIMKISRPVLISSQFNFKATDLLLQSLDTALESGDFDEHQTENFVIKSINLKNTEIYGIFLQNCSTNWNQCDLVPITDTTLLINESFILANKIVAAVALSEDLYYQLNNYSNANSSYIPKLILSIHYGSQLFVELSEQKFSQYVFGVLFPDFTQEFSGPLTIYYFNSFNTNSLGYNCSYWNFDSSECSSWTAEGTENINKAVYCEFYHVTNFGIPSNIADEYCDVTKPSEHDLDCCNEELKKITRQKRGFVKYQNLCEHLEKTNNEHKVQNLINEDFVECTVFLLNNKNTNSLSKYCITGNASVIPIKCFEDFNEESNIFDIMENCITYSLSNVSRKLLDTTDIIKEDCWNSLLDIMFLLSENYTNFNDLDLLIVATLMNSIAYSKPDLQKIVGIINNIMKIPTEVFNSAQRKFKAMDTLLHSTEEVLKLGDCSEWKSENFAIKCININSNNTGLIVKNCTNNFNDCNFSPLAFNTDDGVNTIHNKINITSNETQAQISLTEGLYNQIITYAKKNVTYIPKLIISIYAGPQFFVELDDLTSEKNIFSFVFGILLPDFNEKFENPIQIYYLNNVTSQNLLPYNCTYWKYDDIKYGSWTTESTKDDNDKEFSMCEFYHVTHFGIHSIMLNYSRSKNYQLCSLNSAPFWSMQGKMNNRNHRFITEKEKTQKVELRKHENKFSVNNFIINIVSTMKSISHNYVSMNKDYYSPYLGSILSTSNNGLTNYIASLNNKSTFNETINYVNEIKPNVLPTCYNYESKYTNNIQEGDRNITYNFEKMRSGHNANPYTILNELEDLLLKHSSDDINEDSLEFFANKLHEAGSYADINTITALGNILNIIIRKLSTDTVNTAQRKFKSTDRILHSVDMILQEFKTSVLFKKEDIILLIISKKDISFFSGFCVTKSKEVLYIRNKNEMENVSNNAEIDFCVMLSSLLHEQIKANRTRIIFVMFYNNIYFPDKESSIVIKPIIEIIFPDLKENLKANFTITYKNIYGLNKFSECAYWDYLVKDNKVVKSGSWKKEVLVQFNGNWVSCVFNHATHFALVTSQNITTNLEHILNSNLTGLEKLKQVVAITSESYASLIPVDIFLISQIIGSSLSEGAVPYIISRIISNLFNVPQNVLRRSQEIHSATDIILYNIDKMAAMLDDTYISYTNFSLIVKYLDSSNLTGILLHDCKEYICTIDQINDFIDVSGYINQKTMSAMLIFSQDLVEQIKNLTFNSKVIISIYYSNALFNEIGNDRNTTKVFGVVFPGLNTSLDGKVSVLYNIETKRKEDHECAYWSYKADPGGNVDNAILGQWMNDTSKNMQDNSIICSFSHVTHFAMLLSSNNDYNDNVLLAIITDIGCILSLIGIIIILLTGIFFKRWRQNTGNKILINFSIAISLKIGMLYISQYIRSSSVGIGCTITGTILHYAILSECAWMLIIAILQFKRFVEVLGGPPKYVLVKALISGWVFPIIPVVCLILIDPNNYTKGQSGLCYPSHLGLYLGIWLPVVIIVSINCVIFMFIMYNVFHKKTEYIDNANHEILFQWRLALLLFFMLGLTWLFGFLGEIKGDPLFTFLFGITASLQGFILFLFFIVFNKNTRLLYSHCAKQWFYSKGIFKLWQAKS